MKIPIMTLNFPKNLEPTIINLAIFIDSNLERFNGKIYFKKRDKNGERKIVKEGIEIKMSQANRLSYIKDTLKGNEITFNNSIFYFRGMAIFT